MKNLPYLDPKLLKITRESNPLFTDPSCADIKDPNITCKDGLYTISYTQWDSRVEQGGMGLAVAHNIHGPWSVTERRVDSSGHLYSPVAVFDVDGQPVITPQLCAPSVFGNAEGYHMVVQEACFEAGKNIIYATSADGLTYQKECVVLSPEGDQEALVYDPDDMHEVVEWDPATNKSVTSVYITYSGAPKVGQPDIYLAKSLSGTRRGPWQRVGRGDGKPGPIISHSEVPFHNPIGHPTYEWGLEGSQVRQVRVDVKGKHRRDLFIGVAVAFLSEGTTNLDKQRVFMIASRRPNGPYFPLGLLFEPPELGWESGENGHASLHIDDELVNGHLIKKLYVVYQARSKDPDHYNGWLPGLVTMDYDAICKFADHVLDSASGKVNVIYRVVRKIINDRRKAPRL